MTARVLFTPVQGAMHGSLTEVPVFPDDRFWLVLPEAIGDVQSVSLAQQISVQWSAPSGSQWVCLGQRAGELGYSLTVTTGYDVVDVHIQLTNLSSRFWTDSMGFSCLNASQAPSISDYDLARHWARSGQRIRRLTELPRKYSARPTLQVYAVQGGLPLSQIPFADGFDAATPGLVLENWLAIQSPDGARLAAAASHPASFLFQNAEFSCVHSCPRFGPLGPGQTSQAWTRFYLTEMTLDDWYLRMKADLGL